MKKISFIMRSFCRASLVIVGVLLSFSIASCQDISNDDRTKGWQSDIDFLLQEIREQHYTFKKQSLPDSLIVKAETLKKNISDFVSFVSSVCVLCEPIGCVIKRITKNTNGRHEGHEETIRIEIFNK